MGGSPTLLSSGSESQGCACTSSCGQTENDGARAVARLAAAVDRVLASAQRVEQRKLPSHRRTGSPFHGGHCYVGRPHRPHSWVPWNVMKRASPQDTEVV